MSRIRCQPKAGRDIPTNIPAPEGRGEHQGELIPVHAQVNLYMSRVGTTVRFLSMKHQKVMQRWHDDVLPSSFAQRHYVRKWLWNAQAKQQRYYYRIFFLSPGASEFLQQNDSRWYRNSLIKHSACAIVLQILPKNLCIKILQWFARWSLVIESTARRSFYGCPRST